MKIFKDCIEDQITQAAQALMDGHLVAFPTETVYGLGADASNASAVSRIYEVKGRPKDHPLIVHISSVNQFTHWASEIPDYAFELATRFWPGPMTLILPRSPLAKDFITGNQNNVGLRVPANPIALNLLSRFEEFGGLGVVAPSANRFGAVSPTSAGDVVEEIGADLNFQDFILDGGQCSVGIESTIIDCSTSVPSILRPGAITHEEISKITRLRILNENINKIKSPGSMDSHYAPKAVVKLDVEAMPGDGFIAMAEIPTPEGAIRLSAPLTSEHYARELYAALRLGDQKKLMTIVVIQPKGNGIEEGIRERLIKSANGSKKQHEKYQR